MGSIRLPGLFGLFTSALAATSVCALPSTASAASAAVDVAVGVAPAIAAARLDPPPEEKCPNGEPKPCGAADKERDGVESGRADSKKDVAAAKTDIAAAKQKAEQCPPGSTQCMQGLIGGGAEQHKGMDDARAQLAGLHPGPSDNAASAVAGTCQAFAADLPPVFKGSADSAELTGLCEAMHS
jgi:hypothetical protein